MTEGIAAFREVMANRGKGGPHGRLLAAMGDGGPADLASLLRHVVRQEELAQGSHIHMPIPADIAVRIGPQTLRSSGIRYLEQRDSIVIVGTDPWSPKWVHGDIEAVDLAISAPHGVLANDGSRTPSLARASTDVPVDPFVSRVTRFTSYRGVGQREAVRAAVRCPDGEALYVVLPTGTGKSLVGMARGIVDAARVTVVVVPTIALALDQEREVHANPMADGANHRLAYTSDLSEEERRAMRERLRSGDQHLIFTSPESATGGLASVLLDLAAAGRLATIVIDEAHMIPAWGDDFRPHFQLLPALRRALVAAAGINQVPAPATLLMTATLTQGTYEKLNELFGLRRPEMVHVSALRPEPRYLVSDELLWADRPDRLVEALRHLPRPTIVYVTEVKECDALVARLRSEGFSRVAAFSGNTGTDERRAILEGWCSAAPTVDVVVGTSAFGLGVNLQDVRAVVHCCIPESLDRFYQEVGRGGRDHHAAVSLLMPAPGADKKTAHGLSRKRIIGQEKGFARWTDMRDRAVARGVHLDVRVDTIPAPRPEIDWEIKRGGDKNIAWNRLTLNLMAASGLVELDVQPPPRRGEDEDVDAWSVRAPGAFAEWAVTQRVRVLGHGMDDETAWGAATEQARSVEADRADGTMHRMMQLVDRRTCVRDALRAEYSLDLDDRVPAMRARPSGACTGCPHCAELGLSRRDRPAVVDNASRCIAFPVGLTRAGEALPFVDSLAIFVGPEEPRLLRRVARALARRAVTEWGIACILDVGSMLGGHGSDAMASLDRASLLGWVALDSEVGSPPFTLPTLVLVPSDLPIPPAVVHIAGSPRVLLCGPHARDPLPRRLTDDRIATWRPTTNVETII